MLELHLDPVGGIAGDMFVAALLDLRPDLEPGLRQTLALCPLIETVDCELRAHHDGVLTGHRFLVTRRDAPPTEPLNHDEAHHHGDHAHDHHDHADHRHDKDEHDHYHHTAWHLIREALITSRLDPETVKHAVGIFRLLAVAEGRVHGISPDDVGFHEVGAWDSIADIVAASWLIAQLGATRWTVGPLPLGGGRIRTAHGLLPVPAPATALLLEGFATIDDGIGGERVTPTGAAILRYLCDNAPTIPVSRMLTGSACGFGTRRLPGISNCLRVLAFEAPCVPSARQDKIEVLECEIDDQTGEDLAQAVETLRAQKGVLDVVQAPVFGKKGRMMTHLRILADPSALDDILSTVFDETTTIGIRHSQVTRSVLARRSETIDADGRTLRLKIVDRPSGQTAKLEADDLASVPSSHRRNALRRLVQDSLQKTRKDS